MAGIYDRVAFSVIGTFVSASDSVSSDCAIFWQARHRGRSLSVGSLRWASSFSALGVSHPRNPSPSDHGRERGYWELAALFSSAGQLTTTVSG
jgi:hypothetical protein